MKRSNLSTITIFILSLIAIYGCSSTYHSPESIEEKIDRYRGQNQVTNKIPQLELLPVEFSRRVASRSIASARPIDFGAQNFTSYSNKRIYFLTLLSQYHLFKNYVNQSAPDIKVCPNFHSSILKNPQIRAHASRILASAEKLSQQVNLKKPALYPELYLPIDPSDPRPSVMDSLNETKQLGEKILKALQVHTEKNYRELQELCEYGHSNNYYIFENLVTYTKDHREDRRNRRAMQSLMKTSLFSNMILLTSLKLHNYKNLSGRSPANYSFLNFSLYEEEIFKRLDAEWSKEYFRQLSSQRLSH